MAEAWWACAGAALALVFGAISPGAAASALARGTEVYAFLIGMMLLAEVAARDGLFDWLAAVAVRQAKGSAARLFGIVFVTGIATTVVLSNDATAVVLTPAVLAAVRRAGAQPLPYAYACAFVANAASFVLPISNPANLVLYGNTLPSLALWLARFAVPSLIAIGLTFAAMRIAFARSLRSTVAHPDGGAADDLALPRFSASAILVSAVAIVALASGGRYLGTGTLFCGLAVFAVAVVRERRSVVMLRRVQWAIIPLVAALFVLAGALEGSGSLGTLRAFVLAHPKLDPASSFAVMGAVTALCNLANNLPVGLLAAAVFGGTSHSPLRDVALIAVDLGPNLSVSGSLATVLWLAILRREGVAASAVQFVRYGVFVTLPALLGCALYCCV